MDDRTIRRAEVHAALGEPARLQIVDKLASTDLTPSELGERFGLSTNLLAHHLAILERVGLIERTRSAGDGRRRYVRLVSDALHQIQLPPARHAGRALFVCTQNSARSQLAAALWRERTGADADSAGTRPAERVHPEAVAVAERHGLDITDARPRVLAAGELGAPELVVTVCDLAHEELARAGSGPQRETLHWSVPDPAGEHPSVSFEDAFAELDRRITTLTRSAFTPSTAEAADTTTSTASP